MEVYESSSTQDSAIVNGRNSGLMDSSMTNLDLSGKSSSDASELAHPPNSDRLINYTVDDHGRRIPAPAHKDRDQLLQKFESQKIKRNGFVWSGIRKARAKSKEAHRAVQLEEHSRRQQHALPRTNMPSSPAFIEPLFPPLPLYGPPDLLRKGQIWFFRSLSFFLTLGFLLVIILGAIVTVLVPATTYRFAHIILGKNPDKHRKFFKEERRRGQQFKHKSVKVTDSISYYAALVDIEVEPFTCETLDGFTLHLQRLHDKRPMAPGAQARYPVLLLHGLLQSSGAFCVNDDDSLAFYLCKQGFDVWLGNNRCWNKPEHSVLEYGDPRLWAWNIRQMGGLDLPALIDTVCAHTNRKRIGFVGHSQGTTQTFCSLSRDQHPELGLKMDSFCALAPATHAGALIDKLQFKFMRVLGSKGFRLFFGINAFIPLMMTFQKILPGSWYGQTGYLVFNFLFDWSDALWDRRLKSRFFQFSPVYVSSESMRWWMRDFAIYRSILEDSDVAWFRKETFPPLAFWTCGQDQLVNGQRFTERMKDHEAEVTIVHQECIEEYSHLDILWAMDSVDRVARKVKEVLWACASDRHEFVVPRGCDDVAYRIDPRDRC